VSKIDISHLPPGYFWIEYDQKQIDPHDIKGPSRKEMEEKGYIGGYIFPKGSVEFKSMTDEELAEIGLMRRPA
jgi:hypothetical protein